MELGGLLVVAVVANTTMLALYGLIRLFPAAREHSPSPSSFLRDPAGYVLTSDSMLAQTSAWAVGLLVGAIRSLSRLRVSNVAIQISVTKTHARYRRNFRLAPGV